MLTKLKLALFVAAPLVAGAATYAAAQGDGPARADILQKFDANKDGKLDDSERAQMKAAFEAKRAERHKAALAKFDANKDGKLDATERKTMQDTRLAEQFQKMDTNGDGKLTLDEFKAGSEAEGFRHGRHGHGLRHRGHGGGPRG